MKASRQSLERQNKEAHSELTKLHAELSVMYGVPGQLINDIQHAAWWASDSAELLWNKRHPFKAIGNIIKNLF